MALKELIQEIVDKDYNELVELGKGAFAVTYEYLEPILGEKLVFAVVLGLVTTVAASDRYCSNAELNLVNDITGLGFSAASFRELCGQANDPEFRANLNDIVSLRSQVTEKQDKLTAGENITIIDNVFSLALQVADIYVHNV